MVELSGSGEHHTLPAVAPQHVNAPRPDCEPCLAVGQQQRRHAGPLVAPWIEGLHPQDVEALGGVGVVVAASDGVDEVLEGGHAVPAASRTHGLSLQPHPAAPRRIVTQDVSPIRPDLIVVTPRDVDHAAVDRPGVSVR